MMARPIFVLLTLVLVGTEALDCDSVPGFSVQLVPDSGVRTEGEIVSLQCITNMIPAAYPRWIIGDQVFTVTNLPIGITVDGSNISFPFDGDVDIRCFYTRFSAGSVVNVCSNRSRIVSNGPRAPYYICRCDALKITSILTLMDKTTTYMVGFDELIDETCSASNSIGKCGDSSKPEYRMLAMSDAVAIEVDISNTLYGEDVIFDIEVCDCCNPRIYNLPDFKPTEYRIIPNASYVGTIIDDLSNSFSDCSITDDAAINYTICVHSRDLKDCFTEKCESTKVFPSFCFNNQTTNGPVSLEVNGVDNGTIVSIFCTKQNDCSGKISEVMLFNIQILTGTCHENAEYNAGKCECKTNYAGDGISSCSRVQVSFSRDCDISLRDGRPFQVSWMSNEGLEYKTATVRLNPSGDTVCSNVTGTNCTGTIHEDDDNTISIILTNDDGSTNLVEHLFMNCQLSLSMDCAVPLRDGRPFQVSWMSNKGLDYRTATVRLSPSGDTVCSNVTGTNCTGKIHKKDDNTISIILTNDDGSTNLMEHFFNSTALLTDDNLGESQPNVVVMVNAFCNSSYDVTVSFGIKVKEDKNCDFQQENCTVLEPGIAVVFYVNNRTLIKRSDDQEYCFNATFNNCPSSSGKSGLSPGAIAGIVISGVVAIAVV